ncbi:uncharacterized protein P884DRAFT_190573 [Thermothelomyces heterothallicus CBS 202.75]|uniref:uncharacterized protein n=1 Tax=Thermothelomyces heterothallicus CBS 202.75 TaxID=1149848 RepID=UPI0037441088
MSAEPLAPAPALAPVEDPTIRFTTLDELHEQIDHVEGDILIVTDVSPRDFCAIEQARESRRRKYRFRRYYASTQVLVIAVPTTVHERLHRSLDMIFISKLTQSGLSGRWGPIGATTLRTHGHPGGDGGEGDSTGGPFPERGGRDNWPTLVIEAGYSESLHRLRQDMRWWFDASMHQVKIVLLAKFDRSEGQISLEKWEEEPQAVRSGATTTRSFGRLVPVQRQRIVITQDATRPGLFNVVSGPLILSFRLLFLRDPGPGEEDIVFGIPDLQSYATRVWAAL